MIVDTEIWNKWVVLEDDIPLASGLLYEDAKELKNRLEFVNSSIIYSLFYDEYYEFTEITK